MLTVVICTHNRHDALHRTLRSLALATAETHVRWSLLVVDNASTDRTADVIVDHAQHLPMQCVYEPTLGKSHALNRALAETPSRYMVLTDDDVDVTAGWLAAYDCLLQDRPDVSFAGGKVIPRWQGTPPAWFVRYGPTLLREAAVWYDEGDEPFQLDYSRPAFYGSNMMIDRDAALSVGSFDPDFGIFGSRKIGGEETLLVDNLLAAGLVGIYCPPALVYHRTGPDRWRDRTLLRVGAANGQRQVLLARKGQSGVARDIGRLRRIRLMGACAKGYLVARVRGEPDAWLPALMCFGMQWGVFRASLGGVRGSFPGRNRSAVAG